MSRVRHTLIKQRSILVGIWLQTRKNKTRNITEFYREKTDRQQHQNKLHLHILDMNISIIRMASSPISDYNLSLSMDLTLLFRDKEERVVHKAVQCSDFRL